MQPYRSKTTILKDGTLTIKGLPFRPGEKVEVTVCARERQAEQDKRYPLRGKTVRYDDPFGSVAEEDWGALK